MVWVAGWLGGWVAGLGLGRLRWLVAGVGYAHDHHRADGCMTGTGIPRPSNDAGTGRTKRAAAASPRAGAPGGRERETSAHVAAPPARLGADSARHLSHGSKRQR